MTSVKLQTDEAFLKEEERGLNFKLVYLENEKRFYLQIESIFPHFFQVFF